MPSSYVTVKPDGSTIDVVARTSFRVTFDRLLLPTTTFRQSICLQPSVSGVKAAKDCANGVFLDPAYDPVLRQIVYRQAVTSAGLVPGEHYTLSVFPPPDDGTPGGIQAFDGAPLAAASSRTFTTRAVEPMGSLPDTPPPVDFCGDLYRNVLRDTCAANGCHTNGAPDDHGIHLGAAEGLDFSKPAKIAATAFHVAHGTQTGEHAADPEISPSSFGRAMPIIDPTRPGNSYLLYKLLANSRSGDQGSTPALEQKRLDDLAQLRATVVVGLPMPPSDGRAKELDQARLNQLSAWIAAGASTDCP